MLFLKQLFECFLQDEELDLSPVQIDDALLIEDDDISDDDDDHDDVCPLIAVFVIRVAHIF